jgi:hypothetical protein
VVIDLRESYGRRAYKAYSWSAGGVSLVSGDPLPPWDELPPEIQRAWVAAASAVISGVVPTDRAQK